MVGTVKYLIGSPGESGYGSRSTAEQVTEACAGLSSVTAMITGATSGIGEEMARVLAMRRVRLVLPVRSIKDAEVLKARILSKFPDSEIIVMSLDLSSLSSVRHFASDFQSLKLPLNLLINNAGMFSRTLELTEDGIEMTFATNHLGHFLLTKLLLKNMIETADATGIEGRIVNVTSSIHAWFSGDILLHLDLITRRKMPYDATRVYALSKLANVLHTKELAQRLKVWSATLLSRLDEGSHLTDLCFQRMKAKVTANCVHPGISRTRITRELEGLLTDLAFMLASKFVKSIPQAAASTCYVATHPRLSGISGKYFSDCNEALPSKAASNQLDAARLWSLSEELTDSPRKISFRFDDVDETLASRSRIEQYTHV